MRELQQENEKLRQELSQAGKKNENY